MANYEELDDRFAEYYFDKDGYFFYVPERLICCSLDRHNALVKSTKDIEEMDINGSFNER